MSGVGVSAAPMTKLPSTAKRLNLRKDEQLTIPNPAKNIRTSGSWNVKPKANTKQPIKDRYLLTEISGSRVELPYESKNLTATGITKK